MDISSMDKKIPTSLLIIGLMCYGSAHAAVGGFDPTTCWLNASDHSYVLTLLESKYIANELYQQQSFLQLANVGNGLISAIAAVLSMAIALVFYRDGAGDTGNKKELPMVLLVGLVVGLGIYLPVHHYMIQPINKSVENNKAILKSYASTLNAIHTKPSPKIIAHCANTAINAEIMLSTGNSESYYETLVDSSS